MRSWTRNDLCAMMSVMVLVPPMPRLGGTSKTRWRKGDTDADRNNSATR